MQYKWHFLHENHTFQGHFLHYLVVSNRKLEMLMGIYNAYCSSVRCVNSAVRTNMACVQEPGTRCCAWFRG